MSAAFVPSVAAALVGCGSLPAVSDLGLPATSNGSVKSATSNALPRRPGVLPLDQVEPCSLIAGPAVRELGVGPGTPHGYSGDYSASQCQWSSYPAEPSDAYVARVNLHRDAASVLANAPNAHVIQIANFPAVEVREAIEPARTCDIYVDVAPGQSLLVHYLGDHRADPAAARMPACQKAREVATFMIDQLRNTAR